jgi:hypothetical protein
MCDAYEARLMELVDPSRQKPHYESVVGPDPTLEHGLN